MTYNDFLKSLNKKNPPEVSTYLKALWYDKKDNWHEAHRIAQDIHDMNGSWIHAYLHRVEGDKWNANYWYRQAGKKMPDYSLTEEWEEIVKHFIEKE